ncbi:MAG: cold-shock protein [Oceanococcus sp.]
MTPSSCIGEVLDYDPTRGYGRISDSGDVYYFVHFRDLIATESLEKGQNVEFEAVLSRKGNIARKVRIV